jgi:uncharacterized membrane protein YedE/YeeE
VATLVVAFALGCILGFAAHRASVCTVRAVAEVMSVRSASMFAGVGRTWLWIWAVAFPFLWLVPAAASVNGWPLTAFAVLGGLAFGLGAALNGACAYSTMARLADGEGAMLVAIIGFAAGAGLFALLAGGGWVARPSRLPPCSARSPRGRCSSPSASAPGRPSKPSGCGGRATAPQAGAVSCWRSATGSRLRQC